MPKQQGGYHETSFGHRERVKKSLGWDASPQLGIPQLIPARGQIDLVQGQ